MARDPCQSQVAESSYFPHSFGCTLGSVLSVLALPPVALALFPTSSLGFEPGVHTLCLRYYPTTWRSNLTPTRTYFHRTYSPPNTVLTYSNFCIGIISSSQMIFLDISHIDLIEIVSEPISSMNEDAEFTGKFVFLMK